MRWVAILIAASMVVCAGDLEAIRETQKKLVALRGDDFYSGGAAHELTTLKHQLRDWVESRIANAGSFTYVGAFTAGLNSEFNRQKLAAPSADDDQNSLGNVAPFTISHPGGDATWLQVITGVGVVCEDDDSLYLYEWRDGVWKRRYELEQNDYTQGNYLPRHYVHIEVSPEDAPGIV